MNSLQKACLAFKSGCVGFTRHVQTNASLLENCAEVINRNPRNLELMTIARKPKGYHLEKAGHEFWHKLFVLPSQKHLEVQVHHFKNGPVVTASTREWALRKQLYRASDVAAYTNIGKVLAQRCLESGIASVYCDIDPENSKKLTAFLDELKKGGLVLEEPPVYVHANPWDRDRMIKPWTLEY